MKISQDDQEKHVDADEDVILERQWDPRAFGDKGWCQCWCAVNKNTELFAVEWYSLPQLCPLNWMSQTISCCCEHVRPVSAHLLFTCDSFVQATKDLENYDAERHEEFKRYEMLKEHERREYLKGLDLEKREKEEKRLQELQDKHRQHPKVNAPVGKGWIRVYNQWRWVAVYQAFFF